jgi:hypothetical protein
MKKEGGTSMAKFEIHVNETEGHKPTVKKTTNGKNNKETDKSKKEGK